ncbi:MAG: metallophosphoesterase [Candidatus Diapherotrites archaeon]|nr:metallophosphoesterase [Candidatus Diapherotrites archaeon]
MKTDELPGRKDSDDSVILPGLRLFGLGLFFEKTKTLALADFHLGFEETLNRSGMLVPRTNFAAIRNHLAEKVFSACRPERIVVLGDLKHEFGAPSRQEWQEAFAMLELLSMHCNEIILLRGNHDRVLAPIAEWKNLTILENGFFSEPDKTLFLHGDKIVRNKAFATAETIAIGHEHPAVSIREGVKKEQFKCFLKGKFEGKNLVVLPSLNQLNIGTDLTREKTLSPFLKQDLSGFEVWAVEDKPYYFGKLNNL